MQLGEYVGPGFLEKASKVKLALGYNSIPQMSHQLFSSEI